MKRLAILLTVFACCCVGCDSIPSKEPTESVVDVYQALPLPDLHVSIPERFKTTSSEFYKEYYICEDASIIITEDTADAPYNSVYDYSVKALVEYQNVTSELKLLNDELLHADATAIQMMEFTYTLGEGDKSISKTCMVGYLTDRNSMYIITCKSDVDTYENFREDFLSVIRSAYYMK